MKGCALVPLLVVLTSTSACHRKAARNETSLVASASDAASTNPIDSGVTAGSASTPETQECITHFDYLLPPQKYEDGDMFRALLVDGNQVYFRDLKDVYRMPLTGGSPFLISKAPTMTRNGNPVLWTSGDRLLTQLSRGPIFMASPKVGGTWIALMDLGVTKSTGRASAPLAGRAIFDGSVFYWPEETRAATKYAPADSTIMKVPSTGGDVHTLYKARGQIGQLAKVGDRLVVIYTAPPSAGQMRAQNADSKEDPNQAQGPKTLMTMPIAGGRAERLARFGNTLGGELLLADSEFAYVSGYEDEDLTKPGIYRIKATAGSPLEQIDKRIMHGAGFAYGDKLVFVGSSSLDGGDSRRAKVVLTGLRTGGALSRIACIEGPYATPASAIAGKILLISLFKSDTSMASIIRVPLP